jgi:S-layer homology domain
MGRAVLGITPADTPPAPTTPFFTDVPSTHPFFPFIQKLRELAITSGCAGTQYCPDSPTTRGQMAVFLIRAFFTPPFLSQ